MARKKTVVDQIPEVAAVTEEAVEKEKTEETEEGTESGEELEAESEEEVVDENDEFMRQKCKIIGTNVRAQRKKRKFSIDNLAECIELSASYVGLLERGDRCPSLKSLLKLCELFSVTPDELLLDKSQKSSAFVVSESKHKNYYDAVLSLLHGLSAEELEYVANQLKGLRKLNKKADAETAPEITTYTRKKRK